MEIKTVWTAGKSPDTEINKLLNDGWRVLNITVIALPHDRYEYLQANFIYTMGKDHA